MKDIRSLLSVQFAAAIRVAYGDEYQAIDPQITVTGNPDFGDFQANLAMSLAGKLGAKPRDVAATIVRNLKLQEVCEKIEIAGPGFINLHLAATFINEQMRQLAADPAYGLQVASNPQTVVVDYSAPNIAKEMHVGHLRSTVIGDAIVRILMRQGHRVIRQNHMGDWGTQFGMLIEYLIDSGWESKDKRDVIGNLDKRYQESKRKFDIDTDFNERSRKRVVALQSGDAYTLTIWKFLVDESIAHFARIYRRLGVLLDEDDNCPESFYNRKLPDVIAELNDKGMLTVSDGAAVIFLPGFKDRENNPLPMIVQKSDGGYLYATTDLAAMRYRIDELHADRIVYVTDARQAQHFAMLFAAARASGWGGEDVCLDHVPFGTVLGANRKPFKTRDGGTIKLEDLLDEAELRAAAVLKIKNPELPPTERDELARVISVAALKYADLSNDRIKDYVFDWDRMLALDGNTAPYLQNAYVRILSIFRKGAIDRKSISAQEINLHARAERNLALKLFQYPAAVESVADRLEPHRLCTYLYELASCFHAFYEHCPILKEGIEIEVRKSRLALCDLTAGLIEDGLGLLGIRMVDRM